MRVSGDSNATREDVTPTRYAGYITVAAILILAAIRVGMIKPN